MIWIIFIISLVVAVITTNKGQEIYMKARGADVMYFNVETKLSIIVLTALFLSATIIHIFGIQTPQ